MVATTSGLHVLKVLKCMQWSIRPTSQIQNASSYHHRPCFPCPSWRGCRACINMISMDFPGLRRRTYAKNKILMARARPKCKATTTTNKILLVLTSVALNTGYRFLTRKTPEAASPMATKTQFKIEIGDQEIRATGIQIKLA